MKSIEDIRWEVLYWEVGCLLLLLLRGSIDPFLR